MSNTKAQFSKAEASRCNNAAWDLIECPQLTPRECADLVTLAGTARHIWLALGSKGQKAHADLLFAWALARADAGEIGLELARAALAHFERSEADAWELAFAHAACAACSADDAETYATHFAAARRFGDESNDAYFEAAFKTLS